MHKKEEAIAPSFLDLLDWDVQPVKMDTDVFGTFSGEIPRLKSPLETVKEKCRAVFDHSDVKAAIASEGSFIPYPPAPFFPAQHEIMHFIDQEEGYELTLSKWSLETNYQKGEIRSIEELSDFLEKAKFPEHAVIVKSEGFIQKGVQDRNFLLDIYREASKKGRIVSFETDMRAHLNPSRMKVISELAREMAQRLSQKCPACLTRGWGLKEKKKGLLCALCKTPTQQTQCEIYGCLKCECVQSKPVLEPADPSTCLICNP